MMVLERAPNKKSWTMWKCICDCGNELVTYSTHLVRGNVTNCGCLRRKVGKESAYWTGYGEISGRRWNSIRRITHNRPSRLKMPFEIDIQYAWNLFLKQNRKCALTGIELIFGRTNEDVSTASLDRIDSKVGYIEGNVQWVHKDINRMKNIYDQDYFVHMCTQVSKFRGK